MKTITKLFRFFKEHVVEDKGTSHDIALSAFVGTVLHGVTPPFPIDTSKFAEFEREIAALSDEDRGLLQTRMDDLHDERKRRVLGQFYTPVEFVELAHALIDNRLGADWREKYVVWDGSAGSLNLTKGYKFKELYSSTLQQEEVDRNPVSDPATETFFQFDFLSGNVSMLPEGLRNALEANRPILFFMNPPYSTGSMEKTRFGSKTKVLTSVKVQGRRMGLAAASKDLYAQFMIRIMLFVRQYKLTNVVYAVFSPLTFLTSDSLKPFRKRWCDMFCFDRGVLFDAGHFSGTSLNWAIQFSIWKQGQSTNTSGFKYFIVEKNEDGDIVKTGTKYVHNLDDLRSRRTSAFFNQDKIEKPWVRLTPDWLLSPVKEPMRFMPGVTTSFEVVNSSVEGYSASNYVSSEHIGQLCYDPALTVYSTGNNHGRPGINVNTTTVGNLEITPHNFERVMAFLSMARSLEQTFIDQKDYLFKPNTEHPEWRRFVVDSVVFGLFCCGSSHISRYDVDWHGQRYQLPNEFFWMSKSFMMGAARLHENEKTLYTLDIAPRERFVLQWFGQQSPVDQIASAEAMALIRKGTDLLLSTFEYRAEFDKRRPEVQICNWDAGWWQLKELWKATAKEKLKELVLLRNELRQSIQSRIRLLGWLRPREK